MDKVNDKKITFVMCVNDDRARDEALYYISGLVIPDGYEVDVLPIYNSVSMTAGYNLAINLSDAKYKVYMHQDVLILYRNFLFDLLKIFSDKNIGMIGMVGSKKLPETAIMWNDDRVGAVYTHNYCQSKENIFCGGNEGGYWYVEAIDGLFMATQYDIPWREDVFDGWDFYDISQSFEYRKAGYKVVVPVQIKPWCLHDDGWLNLERYFDYRDRFVEEYKGMMK